MAMSNASTAAHASLPLWLLALIALILLTQSTLLLSTPANAAPPLGFGA